MVKTWLINLGILIVIVVVLYVIGLFVGHNNNILGIAWLVFWLIIGWAWFMFIINVWQMIFFKSKKKDDDE